MAITINELMTMVDLGGFCTSKRNHGLTINEQPTLQNYWWTFLEAQNAVVEQDEAQLQNYHLGLASTQHAKTALMQMMQQQIPDLQLEYLEILGIKFNLWIDHSHQQVYHLIKQADLKTALQQHILQFLMRQDEQLKAYDFNSVIKLKGRHYYDEPDAKRNLHYVVLGPLGTLANNKDTLQSRFVYLQTCWQAINQDEAAWKQLSGLSAAATQKFCNWFIQAGYNDPKSAASQMIENDPAAWKQMAPFLFDNPLLAQFDIVLASGMVIDQVEQIVPQLFVIDNRNGQEVKKNRQLGRNPFQVLDPDGQWIQQMIDQAHQLQRAHLDGQINHVDDLTIVQDEQTITFTKQRLLFLEQFWANELLKVSPKLNPALVNANTQLQNDQALFAINDPVVLQQFYEQLKDKNNVYFDFETFLNPTSCFAFWKPDSQSPFQVSWFKDFPVLANQDNDVATHIVDPKDFKVNDLQAIVGAFYDPQADNYIVYNKSFEIGVLQAMRDCLFLWSQKIPEQSEHLKVSIDQINEIITKVVDLRDLFKIHKGQILPPIQIVDFLKKSSIKLVAQFLESHFDLPTSASAYNDLAITRGDQAANVALERYLKLVDDQTWKATQTNLALYCNNDVLQMVKIGDFLDALQNNHLIFKTAEPTKTAAPKNDFDLSF